MAANAYTLHLGFNWYGSTLGYVWDKSTGFYFLQNALADSSGVAAPFTYFKTSDTLSIEIWDLSSSNDWSMGEYGPQLALALAFSDLTSPTTIDPTTLCTGGTKTQSSVNNQYYLQISTTKFSVKSSTNSPWGRAQGNATTLGPLTFDVASSIQCKLSFFLSVTTDSPKYFVSDPEISVSSS